MYVRTIFFQMQHIFVFEQFLGKGVKIRVFIYM
jgi:hypothetical protein